MTKSLEALMVDLKAAADKATPGQWSAFIDVASSTYSVFAKKVDDVIKWVGFDGRKNAGNNAKFIAMASPKNVKALIAALEQAQALATQQGNIGCALFDEVTYLHQRIAELEARPLCVKLPK